MAVGDVASKLDTTLAPPSKGDEIRARIDANRQKRLAIAEAMKAEAGVTLHNVTPNEFGGMAYLATGVIQSPQGRNMRQLHTVAHECGHVFLHRDKLGIALPTHVQELEAEMYAHQAFRAHGMTLPPENSSWGRKYVAYWIAIDQSKGIPICAQAFAFANGTRSPYEPLRKIPETWRDKPGIIPPLPTLDLPKIVAAALPPDVSLKPVTTRCSAVPHWPSRLAADARDWMKFVGWQFVYGAFGINVSCGLLGYVPLFPDITVMDSRWMMHTHEFMLFIVCAGIAWTSVASLARTMRR